MTPEITVKTKLSHESDDRYIKDYRCDDMRWRHDITGLDKTSQLARLSKKIGQEYINLLPDRTKTSKNKSLDSEQESENFNLSGKTETGSAGK